MKSKRTITNDEKLYFLSLKPDDITLDLLHELFTDTYDRKKKKIQPSKFNTYDEFTLKKGEYFNKEDVLTNCGLFIINKFLIEPELGTTLGYCNKPLTKKEIGNIQSKLDGYLREDHISTSTYINFLDRLAWIAFSLNTEVCTSLTVKSLTELPEIKKAKAELRKKYEKDLNSDDNAKATVAAVKIEKELTAMAQKIMDGDPADDLYKSGARGGYGVAYKNAQIMKGPVYNAAKKQFDIMFEPIGSGINKENVPTLANSMLSSQYSKSIATGECGYKTKKLTAVYQSSTLDKRGSDCHSKGFNVVTITNENYDTYSYGFIIEGTKLIRLDDTTKDKYLGKTVKMRSNCYCLHMKTCNMCAGDKFYLLGQENYGLATGKMANTLLNKRMKAMHDSTVDYYNIDITNDFI